MSDEKKPGQPEPKEYSKAGDEFTDEDLAQVAGGMRPRVCRTPASSTYDGEDAEETGSSGSDYDY